MSQIDKHKETFKDEAKELLAELETSLIELEETPEDMGLIDRVFRAMHTIKGSGAMFGFNEIAGFMHDIENVFEHVRNGEIAVTKELINLSLSARDQILIMLDENNDGNPVDELKTKDILTSFKRIASDIENKKETTSSFIDSPPAADDTVENVVYRICFQPEQNIFMGGTNPLFLLEEIRELGDCKIVARTDDIPDLNGINPELCYTGWDIILTTNKGLNAIKDVFIFVVDDCKLDIKVLDANDGFDSENNTDKLGNILVDRGILSQDSLEETLSSQKRLGEILVGSGLVSGESVQSALVEQDQIKDLRKKRKATDTISNIRVPASKLDHFVDLIGELVIIQQRLSQTADSQNNSELITIAEIVERLTIELRDSAFSVRMLPIGNSFNKLKRLIRDLSNDLGREVEMTTNGGETELDKTVIDQLNDPLVHTIRNSIDHGIEPPDVRVAAGKPRRGTVHLSASHSGSNVLIQIKDDGKGMNPDVIKAKAIEKGLITPDAELTEKECFELVFAPGFSTAEKVTSVSGRGVGMDVVKQTIDQLRGSIDIESKHGLGTTITITLPLTLAIIEGLQVEVGKENFILPLSSVEECVELTREDVLNSNGRYMANVRGELVPYIRLREWFIYNGDTPDIEQIVITNTGDRRVGFVVDQVIGEHQTVIKTLGRIYKDAQGVSGATILGNGQVAMILDIPQLIKNAEHEEQSLCA